MRILSKTKLVVVFMYDNYTKEGEWMEELKIGSKETKDFFIHAFKEENLVPILGSGFTCGLKTRRDGIVPSGKVLKAAMIEKISAKKKISKDELNSESFGSISEFYQNTFSSPSEEGVIDYFLTNFTGVIINKPQQLRFLNEINWPYVYTLNIDTGIEDSKQKGWEVFYPNKSFDERNINPDCKRLFKIHGDVAMFCKSLDYNDMILTESQYIASLHKSKQFHDLLSSDCGNKNLLYIGCSLDDEIDIKFSALADKNKNNKIRDIRGIYVTSDELSEFKKDKLEGYNISHFVRLSSKEDYEYFYEFLVQCYDESKVQTEKNIKNFKYNELERIGNDREKNLDYLADLSPDKSMLPFYYVPSGLIKEVKLVQDKVNIIIGRRFVGKTMLAHAILENHPNYRRYFVSEKESLSETDVVDLLHEDEALIVFDSESLDDRGFNNLLLNFDSKKNNIIIVILNSFNSVVNLTTFNTELINYSIEETLSGKLFKHDVLEINERLNLLGIATFNEKNNLLDNTLRISNVYNRKIVNKYTITSLDELKIIIWVLVKNKMYFEEIVTLGLTKTYGGCVKKFAPFIQEEKCKKGEIRKHSTIKVIVNGKLGLLQILSAYIYPSSNSEVSNKMAKEHQKTVCEAIYHILRSFSIIDMDNVKEFLQFDKLNDVFSRVYSEASVNSISNTNSTSRIKYGAASFIHNVYANEKIKKLKANDPNYWLQRAKSIYITNNYKHPGSRTEILEAINWAKKAEQDSRTRIDNGETKYYRTESNAVMQIAMLYGRLAKLQSYKNRSTNEAALEYYYKVFSDTNNIGATKTLLYRSRGTDDFTKFVNKLLLNGNSVSDEWTQEKEYLINISMMRDEFSANNERNSRN